MGASLFDLHPYNRVECDLWNRVCVFVCMDFLALLQPLFLMHTITEKAFCVCDFECEVHLYMLFKKQNRFSVCKTCKTEQQTRQKKMKSTN